MGVRNDEPPGRSRVVGGGGKPGSVSPGGDRGYLSRPPVTRRLERSS